ncbi:MAG: PIN/TRAM domain-containing protein [Planctomycetota bacterium]
MSDTEHVFAEEIREERAQRTRVVQVLRGAFLVLASVVFGLGLASGSAGESESESGRVLNELFGSQWWLTAIVTLVFVGLVIAIDLVTPTRKLSTISAILFGSIAGLLATVLAGVIIDYFAVTYEFAESLAEEIFTIKLMLGLGLCYLGVSTVLQTQDDFRLVIPYVEFAKQFRGVRPYLVDTSTLVDGRVLGVVRAGFVQSPMIVPRVVVDELHALSDSSDQSKRERGRRGLDLLARIQREPLADVRIDETRVPSVAVDKALLERAKAMPATLLTTDTGLKRVARVQDVSVIDLNDLAQALRPSVTPGDRVRIEIVRGGEQPGQGVGFLEDGSMVVVQDGAEAIGSHAEVLLASQVQTANGRLFFARIGAEPTQQQPTPTEPPSEEVHAEPETETTDAADVSSAEPERAAGSATRDVERRVVRPTRSAGASPRNPRRG